MWGAGAEDQLSGQEMLPAVSSLSAFWSACRAGRRPCARSLASHPPRAGRWRWLPAGGRLLPARPALSAADVPSCSAAASPSTWSRRSRLFMAQRPKAHAHPAALEHTDQPQLSVRGDTRGCRFRKTGHQGHRGGCLPPGLVARRRAARARQFVDRDRCLCSQQPHSQVLLCRFQPPPA